MKRIFIKTNKSQLLAFVFSLFLLTGQTLAQESRIINGLIKAQEDQELIPGVSVLVKGTTRGTVTDIDGKFSLEVSNGETLVASFIGYEKKKSPSRQE
ncbi:TonB family protein [Cyclobacterium qasimii M12-11B]|uniref:TonB family protein n=1 Tax=Cyclobacterium qasimii M12-11B TaxID=641524 RepID=S7WS19_9BACT|nr:TonB family protein [Cyclobacterium qasimii M12-11B]